MENIVVIDGKEYEMILKPVGKTEDNKECRTGYEEPATFDTYFYTGTDSCSESECYDSEIDSATYDCGNAVTDEQLGKDRARRNRLLWQLERFSALGRKRPLIWCDEVRPNYYISHNPKSNFFSVGKSVYAREIFQVYFDSKELAEKAIDKFHDELIWFFTEYQDTAEFRR